MNEYGTRYFQKPKTPEQRQKKWSRPGKGQVKVVPGGERGHTLPTGGKVEGPDGTDLGVGTMSPHDNSFYPDGINASKLKDYDDNDADFP